MQGEEGLGLLSVVQARQGCERRFQVQGRGWGGGGGVVH